MMANGVPDSPPAARPSHGFTEAQIDSFSEKLLRKMAQLESTDLGEWRELSEYDRDYYRHCVMEILRLLPSSPPQRGRDEERTAIEAGRHLAQ